MKKLQFSSTSFIIALAIFYTAIIALIWRQINQQLEEDREKTISAAVKHQSNLVFALEQNTIRTLQEADVVLNLVRREVEKFGPSIPLEQLLNSGIIKLPFFDGLALIDRSGRIVNSYPAALNEQPVTLAQREYFKIQKAVADTLYISKPLVSSSIKKPVIVISRRINDKAGNFNGVVAVQIMPATFMAFYKQATLNRYDILSLISPDGITYSRRTGGVESHGENISKSPLFQYVWTKPVGLFFAKDAIRNIPSYFSYRKLKDYPVIATVGSSEFELLADFRQRRSKDYAFGAILTGLLFVFFVFVFINFVQRRKAMNRIVSSEARYRSIFDVSRDAIFLLDPCGRIEATNKAGRKFFKIITLGSDSSFNQLYVTNSSFQQFYSSLVANSEVVFERLDGSKVVGEIASSSFIDADQKEHFLLLIRNVSDRKRMERKLANERRKHQLELTKHMITAQENEREVIGRELHDNVNQVLTTVKLYLETALMSDDKRDMLIKKSIEYVLQSINEIRTLSHSLSAPTLGSHSLVDSIKVLAENFKSVSGSKIEFKQQDDLLPISKEGGLALYRIVQEQLNNIIKHSGATEIFIALSQTADEILLVIQDNGKGFAMEGCKKGIGIRNMESRTLAFGGRFSVTSKPGNGCTIMASLPLCTEATGVNNWN